MATATPETLTQAYRTQQIQRSALIAALVAAWFRRKIDPEDPVAVSDWIDLMLPKILGEHDNIARTAAAYATGLRRLELPSTPPLTFTPSVGAVEQQIKVSLLTVGPGDYLNKARDIRTLDIPEQNREAMLEEAKDIAARNIAAATVRHTSNGGRQTLIDASNQDTKALGYVRVTKDKPCFFCAMLASRGLVFASDSFDASDPRFTGDGTAKVHDNCSCTMKPVYVRKGDPFLAKAETFEELWTNWGAGGGGTAAALRFRRGYEHWAKTGEILDWDVVNSREAFLARNSAA